jgi:hypothetical protein
MEGGKFGDVLNCRQASSFSGSLSKRISGFLPRLIVVFYFILYLYFFLSCSCASCVEEEKEGATLRPHLLTHCLVINIKPPAAPASIDTTEREPRLCYSYRARQLNTAPRALVCSALYQLWHWAHTFFVSE